MNPNRQHIVKTNRKEKFWFHNIRAVNYFCYRFWWIVLLVFFLFLLLWYFYCYEKPLLQPCLGERVFSTTLDQIHSDLDSCCNCNVSTPPSKDTAKKPPLYIPRKNCRVHFSGLLIGGKFIDNWVSKIYVLDAYSEYVGEGDYPDNNKAFPKAVRASFDGIAIDSGTHLIIYSKKNFSGKILLDVVGPKVINNSFRRSYPNIEDYHNQNYPSELQKNYPQSVREWSKSNMIDWSFGSCKIICSQ